MLPPALLAGAFAPASAQNLPADAPVIDSGTRVAGMRELTANAQWLRWQVRQTARDLRPIRPVQLAAHT